MEATARDRRPYRYRRVRVRGASSVRVMLFARFSGAAAHHYVLLDDSFSMTERIGGATAFDYALQAVRSVAERAAEQDGPQRFTLIRFSRASAPADANTADNDAAASE